MHCGSISDCNTNHANEVGWRMFIIYNDDDDDDEKANLPLFRLGLRGILVFKGMPDRNDAICDHPKNSELEKALARDKYGLEECEKAG